MTGQSLFQRPTFVRRTTTGLWILGGVSVGVLASLNRPLVGVALFVGAAITSLALHYNYEGVLTDERDVARHLQASGRTLQIVGLAAAGVFPTLTALWGLGYFEWGPWSAVTGFVIAGLFLLYGLVRLGYAIRE